MNSFGAFRQGGARSTSSAPWTPTSVSSTTRRPANHATSPRPWSSGARPRAHLPLPRAVIVGVAAASVVALGLVIALIGFVATSSPHPALTPPAAASLVSVRTSTGSDGTPGPLVTLGQVTVNLDSSSVGINLTGPGGPQINPNIATGIEPGAALDGIVVPVVKAVTSGTGQLGLHTPTIASVHAIGVNVGAGGKITATVHSYEGLLSTGRP